MSTPYVCVLAVGSLLSPLHNWVHDSNMHSGSRQAITPQVPSHYELCINFCVRAEWVDVALKSKSERAVYTVKAGLGPDSITNASW